MGIVFLLECGLEGGDLIIGFGYLQSVNESLDIFLLVIVSVSRGEVWDGLEELVLVG